MEASTQDWIDIFLIPAIKVLVIFGSLVGSVPLIIVAERKIMGRIQMRPGPNRVGPFGILQGLADGIKLILKEDLLPPRADKFLFFIAPALTLVPAFMVAAIIPFGPPVMLDIAGKVRTITLGITDLPIGILFYFAMTSIGVYGIVLAGWSSNNKYSLLGGIRSTAQLVSYELTLGLSLIGVLLLSGTFEMRSIIASQSEWIWNWNIFQQPLGFALFFVAGFAETNRLPFDLPEGESELGAGFHTEYSSLKFALFFMGEYVNMITFSCVLSTLFLGGFQGPIPITWLTDNTLLLGAWGLLWITIKICALLFFFIWVRSTFPRLRYDQLMNLGWKWLFPLALANVILTAAVLVFGLPAILEGLVLFVIGMGLILGADRLSVRRKKEFLGHAT